MSLYFLTFIFLFLIVQCYCESDSFEHGVVDGPKKTNCTCGRSNKANARIVNGAEADINEYPLIAGIRTQFSPFVFCGGTILTEYHVITAAHCPMEHPNEPLAVVLGDHDVFNPSASKSAKVINVKKIIMHDNYDMQGDVEMDIALFVLESKITFNKHIEPACFPTEKKIDLVGKRIKVMGWGKLYTNGPPSGVLRKVNLDVVPLKKCSDHYGGINMNPPSQLCTYRENKDSCQGDSGGPVVWLDPEINRFTLIALVSFGDQCGVKNVPGVNTEINYHRKWILSKIAETVPSAKTCQKV